MISIVKSLDSKVCTDDYTGSTRRRRGGEEERIRIREEKRKVLLLIRTERGDWLHLLLGLMPFCEQAELFSLSPCDLEQACNISSCKAVSSSSSLNARSQKMPSGISSSASLSSCAVEERANRREKREHSSTPFAVSHRLFSVLCVCVCVVCHDLHWLAVKYRESFRSELHAHNSLTEDHSRRNPMLCTVSFKGIGKERLRVRNLWLLSLGTHLCGCESVPVFAVEGEEREVETSLTHLFSHHTTVCSYSPHFHYSCIFSLLVFLSISISNACSPNRLTVASTVMPVCLSLFESLLLTYFSKILSLCFHLTLYDRLPYFCFISFSMLPMNVCMLQGGQKESRILCLIHEAHRRCVIETRRPSRSEFERNIRQNWRKRRKERLRDCED